MSSISPQKGKGFFQDIRKAILNRLSGRKQITKKLFKERTLTEPETRRKETLKQKKKLTQKEKQELNILNAKIAPREPKYQRFKFLELKGRPTHQKKFNIFYEKEPELHAEIEGLVPKVYNYRKALVENNLQIPNTNIPEPNDLKEKITRVVNGREMELTREKQEDGLRRIFSWFYERAFGRPTASPETISENEFKELQQHIQTILGTTKMPTDEDGVRDSIQTIATEIFGGDTLEIFEQELQREEIGGPEEKKIVKHNGKYYVSESYGAFLGRYLKWFFTDYNRFLMVTEYDEQQCWPDPSQIPNLTNDGHFQRKPLTTLKSNGCISLFNDVEIVRELSDTDGLQNNWLVLDPLYFPEVSVQITSGKKDLTAKYFQTASYIQDALDHWGILAMDPLLWKLFDTKYPEIAIKISTYIFTNYRDKVPLYFQQLKITENFILVDTNIEFEKNTQDFIRLAHRNPFSKDSMYFVKIQEAIQRKKLYGVSPYIAYFMKKTAPTFWTTAFGSRNMETYTLLNANEKIAVDYLQYLRFMDILIESDYNFGRARDSYDERVGEGTVREGILRDIVELYKEELPKHRNELLFFQSLVSRDLKPEDNPRPLSTVEDVTALLLKFTGPAIDYSARRGRASPLTEAVSEARAPVVSRIPPLTIRVPATAPRGQLQQLQSRLSILKGQRNALQKNSTVYNAMTRKRRTRNEVNRRYKNLEKVMRSRSNRLSVQVKRDAVKAKLDKLNALNRNIQSLEQQIARSMPLPASPVDTGAGVGLSPRTASSNNSSNFSSAAALENV